MRYIGQGHEIAVQAAGRAHDANGRRQQLREAFEAEYRRLFERHIPGARIEILSWSVLVDDADRAAEATRAPGAARRARSQGLRLARRSGTSSSGSASPGRHLCRSAIKPGSARPGPCAHPRIRHLDLRLRRFDATHRCRRRAGARAASSSGRKADPDAAPSRQRDGACKASRANLAQTEPTGSARSSCR